MPPPPPSRPCSAPRASQRWGRRSTGANVRDPSDRGCPTVGQNIISAGEMQVEQGEKEGNDEQDTDSERLCLRKFRLARGRRTSQKMP
eukprot:5203914-Prymnesium_polylepis.1